MTKRLIIAYACEDKGSEPGVGYHWTKAIAKLSRNDKIIVITRKNNNISDLEEEYQIQKIGIDLPDSIITIKKYLGTRVYYLLWTLLVFVHLLKNLSRYRDFIVHHITFTPIYYPPLYFILPFKFIWGPVGGGEVFPNAYLKSMKLKDTIKEIIRKIQKNSIFINPIFYMACKNSIKIICSTQETANLIPNKYQDKVIVELMVFDNDKTDIQLEREKTIVIANRLIHWKMTQLFVEAFYEYIKLYPTEYKLIIIGDGPYVDKVSPYVDNINIFHHKRFEERDEMFTILRKSSLFVSMSLHDSGAASLLEAISYHIPFIVTNAGAHRVFLDKGIGFGFDLENYNTDKVKIIAVLKNILHDPKVLEEEIKRIEKIYKEDFSEKAKYVRLERLFNAD